MALDVSFADAEIPVGLFYHEVWHWGHSEVKTPLDCASARKQTNIFLKSLFWKRLISKVRFETNIFFAKSTFAPPKRTNKHFFCEKNCLLIHSIVASTYISIVVTAAADVAHAHCSAAVPPPM